MADVAPENCVLAGRYPRFRRPCHTELRWKDRSEVLLLANARPTGRVFVHTCTDDSATVHVHFDQFVDAWLRVRVPLAPEDLVVVDATGCGHHHDDDDDAADGSIVAGRYPEYMLPCAHGEQSADADEAMCWVENQRKRTYHAQVERWLASVPTGVVASSPFVHVTGGRAAFRVHLAFAEFSGAWLAIDVAVAALARARLL